MKVGIIGAGAMGSLFASHLVDGGAEVWAFDQWREHIDAIEKHGLIVKRTGSERAIRLKATADASAAGPCDAVLVMVKYHQTVAALRASEPMIGPHTTIITLQNGLGNVENIASAYPANCVVFGLTTLTCEMLGPGKIEASYSNHGETYLWPADRRTNEAIAPFCAHLNAGGINASLAPDIELRIWKKLIVNCCLNTMCAITGLSVGILIEQPSSWPLLDGVADEISAVAIAKRIPLEREIARAFLRQVAEEARAHYPSMLIDVRSRRQTEVDCLNGAVLREAGRLGIRAPYNQALYSTIRVIESTYAERSA
jgi:2-dehydropantoate 2-reductase